MKNNKRFIISMLTAISMLILTAIMIKDLYPLVKQVVANAGHEQDMVEYINSYGAKGVPILMGLMALQIILAFIPSVAIQILTGLCYGAWWGGLINIAGCVIGNIIVFVSLRQMRYLLEPYFKKKVKKEGVLNPDRLSKMKRPEVIAFFFYLIPGIPNGILPYIFAYANVPMKRYIVAMVLGSIPSTFVCTYLGDSLSTGNKTVAIIITVVTLISIIIVLIFKKKIMSKLTNEENWKLSKAMR